MMIQNCDVANSRIQFEEAFRDLLKIPQYYSTTNFAFSVNMSFRFPLTLRYFLKFDGKLKSRQFPVCGGNKLLDSTRLRHEIMRMYDKDPQGWNVSLGRDRSGFFDILIGHGTKAWQLKEYQVNPYKFVGLGTRIPKISPQQSPMEHPFGLRPISPIDIKELTNLIEDPKGMNEFALKLLNQKPVSTDEALESPAILHGPVMQSSRPLDTLSSAHTRLDEKLRKELQRIVNRDFRHTITPYI